MKEEDRKIGPEIHCTDLKLSRNLSAHVRKSGVDEVTMMHGWIIRYLYENREQDIFQKDIEQRFAVGRSTVTNLLQLMEKKGFVRRESVKQDARLKKSNPDRKKGLQARNLLKILWSISKKSFPKEYQKKNFIFFIRY